MAITITSPTQITLSGGSAGAPLTIAHLLQVANWPAGTTQATVDSYVRGGAPATLQVATGVIVTVTGYLTLTGTCVIHGGGGARLVAGAGGTITGGGLVGSYRFAGPTWVFPLGCFPEHGTESFVTTGRLDITGLTIILSPIAGQLGVNFLPSGTGSYSLTRMEIVSTGSDAWLNLGQASTPCTCELDQAQVHVVRQQVSGVNLSFGSAGVAGQISGLGEQFKLLVPNGSTVRGVSLALGHPSDYAAITTPAFASPALTFLDCSIDPAKAYTYPTGAAGAGNVLTHQTTTTVSPVDSGGAPVGDATVYAASAGVQKIRGAPGAYVLTHAVGTGATTGAAQYKGPTTLIDHRSLGVIVQHAAYLRYSGEVTLGTGARAVVPALAADPHYSASAIASGVNVSYENKTISVTQGITCDGLYRALKQGAALPANVDAPWYFAASGTSLSIAAPWVLALSAPLLPGDKVERLILATAVSGANYCACGLVDANGDSYLSFAGIDSWVAYSDAGRTVQVGAGTGSELFRFVYSPGVTYYLRCVAGSTEFAMVSSPAAAGETEVTLSTQALLTALQGKVADVKADTGFIKLLSM